jgi:hypothetical protein
MGFSVASNRIEKPLGTGFEAQPRIMPIDDSSDEEPTITVNNSEGFCAVSPSPMTMAPGIQPPESKNVSHMRA